MCIRDSINTLVQMVDKVGGISILPELAIIQLSDEQKRKVARFRKPFPYREISIIYYKPTYKQKIIDEFVSFVKQSLQDKLNFNRDSESFVNVKLEINK